MINIEKSQFCRSQLKYLGFLVDNIGLRTDLDKVDCILSYPKPKTLKEIRRFIGMTSWYRRLICNFAEIAAPLHDLLKTKTRTIKWSENAEAAFTKLKSELIKSPVLAMPDFSRSFVIQCDTSNKAIGAVLVQKDSNTQSDRPIAFVSRKLRGAELNAVSLAVLSSSLSSGAF